MTDLPPSYEVHVAGEFDADFRNKADAKAYRKTVLRESDPPYSKRQVRIYKTFYEDVTP